MSTIAAPIDFAALRARCSGPVSVPGDAGFDQARMPWNVAVDQHPAAVVFPADAADVAAAVTFAAQAGLRVVAQGTGHGAGMLGDLGDTLLVRTSGMTRVQVDTVARRAHVDAGVLMQDVVAAAAEHGLAPVSGSSPDVGVVGFSLGGGIGYLSRKLGLACNSVTAVELVTPDGRLVRCDHEHEPELFWALRGAGAAGFGVVCALEIELHPVPELHAGGLFWPWEEGSRVVPAWAEWVEDLPDEITSMIRFLQFPPFPEIPEPLRGKSFVNVQYAVMGAAAEAEALVAPMRALGPVMDTSAPMPLAGLVRLHGDPEGPTPGLVHHAMLDGLPAEAVDAFVAHAGPGSGSPLVAAELRHLGGALARVPEGAGATGRLDAAFVLETVGIPAGPDMAAAVTAHQDRLVGAMAPYGSGRSYMNFAERRTDVRTMFDPETHERIAAVKGAVDPEGRVRGVHEDA